MRTNRYGDVPGTTQPTEWTTMTKTETGCKGANCMVPGSVNVQMFAAWGSPGPPGKATIYNENQIPAVRQ
jgi:hypothetical protein